MGDRRAAAVSVFLAEYEFVSGLIPFYRRIELAALVGTAGVIGAVVGAIAAIQSGNNPDPEAEATLLALTPWVVILLLLVQIMALTRIRRAALFIKHTLRPLAKKLSGKNLLRWEVSHTRMLLSGETHGSLRWLTELFVTSAPVTIAILAPGVVLPVIAAVIHPDGM